MRLNSNNFFKTLVVLLCVLYKILIATGILSTNSIITYCIILMFFLTALISMFYKKMHKRDLLILCFFVALGLFSILNVTSVNYIFPIIIAGVFYDKDNEEKSIQDLIRIFIICLTVGLLIVIVLNLLGIIPSHNLIRYKNGNVITRYSLGFTHPAFIGLYFIFISFGYFALHKVNIRNFIVMLILSFAVYKVSDSRTTLICNLIFLFMLLPREDKTFGKFIKKISPYMFTFLTIFTFIAIWLYIKYNLKTLDEIFSNRLMIYDDLINNLGILKSPFGINKIDNIVLDNCFLAVFLYLGFVGYILWTIINIKSMKKLRYNYAFSIIQIAICIYGLTDTNVIVTSVNFMISVQFLTLLYSVQDFDYKKIKSITKNQKIV